MKCLKCEAQLHYGDKFCNTCGTKVEKGAYDADYAKTIWGKFDKLSNWWEVFTLKKFIDNWIVKVIVLVLVLGWGFFDAYTEITNIKFLASENYTVEYNKQEDEYYIRTNKDEIDLNLYIPKHSEKITITEYSGDEVASSKDMPPEVYKETPVRVKNNKSDFVTISSVRNDKITDTIKFYVTE